MKSSSLVAALAIALTAPTFSQASVDLMKLPPVVAFYKQPEYCMYTADIPENQSEAFEREFSRAVDRRLDVLGSVDLFRRLRLAVAMRGAS